MTSPAPAASAGGRRSSRSWSVLRRLRYVAWLLRYVAGHNFGIFIVYRIALGIVVLGLVATGVTSAT